MDQGEKGMQLKHYLYRVEFQARLAPHIHGCAWMKEEKIKHCQIEGTFEYDTKSKNLQKLIDEFVTCELPDDEGLRQTVQELQSHKCTKTCTKKGPDCRFGFPKLPSKKTFVSIPVNKDNTEEMEKFKKGKKILAEMKTYLSSKEFNKDLSLDDILIHLNIDGKKYEEALAMSERGKQVILKRKPKECFINNYNKRFLDVYQANMDIQFCMDSYAVVTYVCDYWSKDETGMTDFLKQALKEAKSLENKELLSHLKRTYMAKRQIGK